MTLSSEKHESTRRKTFHGRRSAMTSFATFQAQACGPFGTIFVTPPTSRYAKSTTITAATRVRNASGNTYASFANAAVTPELTAAATPTTNSNSNNSSSSSSLPHSKKPSSCPPSPSAKLPTPLHLSRLESYIAGYADADQIVDGFKNGFPIPSTKAPSELPFPRNHESCRSNPDVVRTKLDNELLKDRIAGPFSDPPFSDFVCSPLGLVPKSSSNSFRLIHDLSFPKHDSVNSHIDPAFTSVQYETLDDCVAIIQKLGPGSLIAKADLEDAFRILPISPSSYSKLGFMWDGSYYFDKCLPMGCAVSCQYFETFSSSLQWILTEKLDVPFVSHILDDFIFFRPRIL